MPEDQVNETPDGALDAPNPETPQVEGEGEQQTFDREYVEKLRKEAADRRAALRAVEKEKAELAKQLERAGLDDMGRLKAERDEYAQKIEALEAQVLEAGLKTQLAGQVADPDVALLVIRQSDEYVQDGQVQIDKLLSDKPYLRATPEPKAGPAPTTAGGGKQATIGMNDLIRRKAGR